MKKEPMVLPTEVIDDLLEGFDPRQSSEDRRLLFEVCNMRMDQDDFRDSSDEDPGSTTLVRNID